MVSSGDSSKMKALKALVLVMGLLIVFGVALLAYGMFAGFGRDEGRASSRPDTDPLVTGFGVVGLEEAEKSNIAEILVDGHVLVIRVSGGGEDRLHLLDIRSGHRLGKVVLGTGVPDAR